MALLALLALLFTLPAAAASSIEALTALYDRARKEADAGHYEFARVLLEPVLIAAGVTPTSRAQAYYYRGLTFFLQQHWVSAAQDYERALQFDANHADAVVGLARMLLEGQGVARDPERAATLLLGVARAGGEQARAAMHLLGILYLEGTGLERSVGKARHWLRQSVEFGNSAARPALASALRAADDRHEAEVDEARQLYEASAADGLADGALGLGYLHGSGELGSEDPVTARKWFERAAELGSTTATAVLATMLMDGVGGDRDPGRARELARLAAEGGEPRGQAVYGFALENGIGGARDLGGAVQWYERAHAAGDRSVTIRLGFMHHMGLGTVRDAARARALYLELAESGDPVAQNGLAWLLATTPDDAVRDAGQALYWAGRATEARPIAEFLDTLAAAQAASGDFPTAIATMERAIAGLGDDHAAIRVEFDARIAQYRRNEAFIER